MYFKFISNLLEYNIKHNTFISHNDLNRENMIIHDNKLICVDLDSIKIDRDPIEHNFITYGAHEISQFIDDILRQSYEEKQKEHRNMIAKLKEELGKNK